MTIVKMKIASTKSHIRKLDLGCALRPKKDYINLDIEPLPNVDVVHDMNKFPYPFSDNYFEEIYCQNVLYLLDDWHKVIKEMHRISKNKAKWTISVPYYNSRIAYNAYTKNFFTLDSFNYYNGKILKVRKKWLEPTKLGLLIPPFLRNYVGMVLGEINKKI